VAQRTLRLSEAITHLPEKTGLKPASIKMRFTSSRLSPWISMQPPFKIPPTPQALRHSLHLRVDLAKLTHIPRHASPAQKKSGPTDYPSENPLTFGQISRTA